MQRSKWIIAIFLVIITGTSALLIGQRQEVNKNIEIEEQEENLVAENIQDIAKIKQYTLYTVDLSVDPEGEFFEGIAQISYPHEFERVTDQMIMNVGNMEIKSVRMNLDTVTYEQDGSNLEIRSPFSIQMGEEVTITIEYQGKVRDNHKDFIPTLLAYDEGLGWVRTSKLEADGFRLIEPANYRVTVHTYENQYPIGTGTLDDIMKEDGMITTTFSADRVRGFGMFIGDEMEREIFHAEDGYSIALYFMSEDDIVEDLISEINKSLSIYSRAFGSYPYDQLTVIYKKGLEIESYPTLLMGDFSEKGSIYSDISKPIGQQWLYYIIGNHKENECWLSTGLLEYINKKFFLSEGQMDLYVNSQDEIGTSMFYEIEHRIGEEKFIEALRAYYKKFSFQKARGEDFIRTIEEISGESIMDIYEFWLTKMN